MASKDVL